VTAEIIQFSKASPQVLLECSRCGKKIWAIVCEGNQIARIVCPTEDCPSVFDFADDGIEVDME